MVGFDLFKNGEDSYILETVDVRVDLTRNGFSHVNDFMNVFHGLLLTCDGDHVYIQQDEDTDIIELDATVVYKTGLGKYKIQLDFNYYVGKIIPILCAE